MPTEAPDQSAPIADPGIGVKMFPDRTTEEVVAEIVASDTAKHSTPLAERLRRAQEAASAGDEDAWESFCRARVSEIGGDFDEMLPGNKPRYTVEENGDVKDHDTGEVHRTVEEAPTAQADQHASAAGVGTEEVAARSPVEQGRAGDPAGQPEAAAGDQHAAEGGSENADGVQQATVGDIGSVAVRKPRAKRGANKKEK